MDVHARVRIDRADWAWSEGQTVHISIENMVYTCNMQCSLNLDEVCTILREFGPQYNRKKFAAPIIRFRESSQETRTVKPPKIALLVSPSLSLYVHPLSYTIA